LINPAIQQNSADSAGLSGLPTRITQAIKNAAARTGVDFSYLLNKAAQESGFDPNAKASSSSATGLFQFTNQTWLQMIKQHGAAYGLGTYADQINVNASGVAHVQNPAWKQAILALRKDPQISAEMAGELDKQNLSSLQGNVGGKIGGTELYLAHFLGVGGASDFLNEMHSNPNATAANVLPEAASANPSVFYNATGQPRTLTQIYRHFAQRFNGSSAGATSMLASAQPTPNTTQTVSPYSYTMASAAYSNSSNGSYAPVTSSVKANAYSVYSSMVLAQMEMDKTNALDLSSLSKTHHNDKNALDSLFAVG